MPINFTDAYRQTQARLQPNRPNYNARVEGEDLSSLGGSLTAEGLSNSTRLAKAYEQMLAGGSVLPQQTKAAYARARAMVTDRNTRDIASTSARLGQARVASGGRLTAEAAQEYLTEAEAEANRAAQEAGVGLDMNESAMEMAEVNTLRDRVQQAYDLVTEVGQNERRLGASMRLGALRPKTHNGQNTQAIASILSSIIGAAG